MKNKEIVDFDFAKVEFLKFIRRKFKNTNIKDESVKQLIDRHQKLLIPFDTVLLIANIATFELLFISDNIKAFNGFEAQEFYNRKDLVWYDTLLGESLNFPLTSIRRQTAFHKQYGCNLNFEAFFVNTPFYKPNKRLILHQRPISILNSKPEVSAYFIRDITHLTKKNGFWLRFIQGSKTSSYNSFLPKKNYKDIVTPKEKQIIQLFGKALDYKQIAQELNISHSTVIKHMKNAIERTDSKDSTGLIHLCKLCKIL